MIKYICILDFIYIFAKQLQRSNCIKLKIMKTIITNEELYNSTVISVDVNNVKNVTEKSFYANIEIGTLLWENPIIEFDGEFGYTDFQAAYGFIFSK